MLSNRCVIQVPEQIRGGSIAPNMRCFLCVYFSDIMVSPGISTVPLRYSNMKSRIGGLSRPNILSTSFQQTECRRTAVLSLYEDKQEAVRELEIFYNLFLNLVSYILVYSWCLSAILACRR